VPQRLGQHFLFQTSILERIAAAACPAREDLVIEIGPGKGALTAKLLARAARVIAIEVDRELVDQLRARYAGEPRLEIVHADVLQTDLGQWGAAPVVGNLPYYIATPIIGSVVRLAAPRAVFLIQKEVALRLVAKPGDRDYGYLTVRTALFARARLLFDVKPGAFQPPPKVDSAVVLLEPSERARALGIEDPDKFVEFVGHCFRQKRKMLRNNLAPVYGREVIEGWPEAALRAETLSLERFAVMYRRLASQAD